MEKFNSGNFLEAALKTQCCARKCLTVLSSGTIQELLRGFWERTEEEQRAFIIDYLHFAYVPDMIIELKDKTCVRKHGVCATV